MLLDQALKTNPLGLVGYRFRLGRPGTGPLGLRVRQAPVAAKASGTAQTSGVPQLLGARANSTVLVRPRSPLPKLSWLLARSWTPEERLHPGFLNRQSHFLTLDFL